MHSQTPDKSSLDYKGHLIELPPNRVWRTYQGGAFLDKIAGYPPPYIDDHFPEDWIASTTQAINPGRETIIEGISNTLLSHTHALSLPELIAIDPEYFLGSKHIEKCGSSVGMLTKFLDSSTRLHFQCHPTASFSKQYLDSPHGKLEAYHILDIREDVQNPYLYLGFQNPPSKDELARIVTSQDIQALEACFEKIPVKVGETYWIPGGIPHAIGEGIFMVEIMEPSDWAARIEFERNGFTIPEEARFLGRDIDFALSIFNYECFSVTQVREQFQCQPETIEKHSDTIYRQALITRKQTNCFSVYKSFIKGHHVQRTSRFFVGIVTRGKCKITTERGVSNYQQFEKFFCPCGLESIHIESQEGVEILECFPPSATELS